MGALGAALAAAAGAIAKTVSDATTKKPGGTSSGGSSGSGRSSGKTTSSGGSSGKTIEQYQQDWKDANERGDQAGMDAAHAGAQALRAQTGYAGGAAGRQQIRLG